MNFSPSRTLAVAAAGAAIAITPASLYARGGHAGGGHAGGAHVGGAHVGGAHVGGAHVGGAHHVGGVHHGGYYGGGYYGSGIYRGGLYGLGGYGIGGYGLGGYGIGSYGLSSYGLGGYYGSSYSPSVIYSNPAPLLSPINSGSAQVISLYPSTSDVAAPSTRPTLNANDGTGTILVRVPANSDVFWNGTSTIPGGAERIFGTLPLDAQGAIHRFEARWTDANGQTVTQSRDVRALPNQTVVVDFTAPQQPVVPANRPATPAPAANSNNNNGVPELPPVPDPFK